MLKMNRPIFIIQGDRIVFGVEEPQHDSRFQVVKSKEQICDDGFSFGTFVSVSGWGSWGLAIGAIVTERGTISIPFFYHHYIYYFRLTLLCHYSKRSYLSRYSTYHIVEATSRLIRFIRPKSEQTQKPVRRGFDRRKGRQSLRKRQGKVFGTGTPVRSVQSHCKLYCWHWSRLETWL